MSTTPSTEPHARWHASLEAMQAQARALGGRVRAGDVVRLEGVLGAGKTTFTRALGEGMRLDDPRAVCSPTYTVCMVHEPGAGGVGLVHLDLFRSAEGGVVGGPAFDALGLEHDELPGPGQALVVEWSELWADPPEDAARISIVAGEREDVREVFVWEGPPHLLEWAKACEKEAGEALSR